MMMKFKQDFLKNYLCEAPVALAVERTLECNIMSKLKFEHPILDIGCGEGLFAHMLFDEPIDTGIDPNPSELDKARAYGAYAELINCYGDKIPKPSVSYRTVFSNSVLEHIADLPPVLREIHRLLAGGGVFYATVPSNYFDKYNWIYQGLRGAGLSSTAEKYSRFFNKFWRHYHYYDVDGWTRMFSENGFTVQDVRSYGRRRTCMIDDLMVAPALPSFINKKLLNRWFLSPSLRKVYSPSLASIFRHVVNHDDCGDSGGLFFFKLVKAK